MSFLKNHQTNWQYLLMVTVLAVIVGQWALELPKKEAFLNNFPGSGKLIKKKILEQKTETTSPEENKISINGDFNDSQQFRNRVIRFIREAAEKYLEEKDSDQISFSSKELEIKGNWKVEVKIYHQGEVKGQAREENEILSLALKEATEAALNNEKSQNLTKEDLGELRFLVKFFYPPHQFSFIESNGQGKELLGDLVAVRNLDKNLIYQKINEGKEFLYRMEHQDKHGFYKKYDVLNDRFENRLHTVYSASIIYTFLYIYDLEKDFCSELSEPGEHECGREILKRLSDWGNFLLSMQNRDEKDERYGAFHYSYYLETKEKEKKFVVGTSALSIFTLLRLYEFTNNPEYLESAKLAGNWLTTMQRPDGGMKSSETYSDGQWLTNQKESLLYDGQVLSALSKLYKVTGDEKYYQTAKRIAQRFVDKYEQERGYIQGEYREKNPISNSWVVMSLMDFYKATRAYNEAEAADLIRYRNIIFELSEKILKNQRDDSKDLLYFGSWRGAYSTSGTGWMTEVMTETYKFCQAERKENCRQYKDGVVRAIRWLIQNTYSEENTFFLKNSEKAIGGVFWNRLNKYVRTDSVCHALNGYVLIFNDLEDNLLLSVPEKPFGQIFSELKK